MANNTNWAAREHLFREQQRLLQSQAVQREAERKIAARQLGALALKYQEEMSAPGMTEDERRKLAHDALNREYFSEEDEEPVNLSDSKMPMSTVDAEIKRKLQERRNEREVTARLALVDAYGEDTYPVGTVITFEKKFTGVKKTYTYAAIKGDEDKWFSTGHDCVQGATFTWDSLIEFLVTGPFPVKSFVLKAEGGTTVPVPTEQVKS